MPEISHHIANATGELDLFIDLISASLKKVIPIAQKDLGINGVDIFFISASALTIPEYGIGGNTPGPNHVYISFDPDSNKITQDKLNETLFHELHHTMRWRDPGYGDTLGEAIITEGLACLYEEQATGNKPIYAGVELPEAQIKLAIASLGKPDYDHNAWFFGSSEVVRWFGYSYGYNLCKEYAIKNNKTASELVHTSAQVILKGIRK